ncbi:hypothetical protein OUZ56_033367 [Daphnia magna]|uniref:Uncharacterized protein n=1 Tax=Daphnia magna TaxID=35525 RepID=A0ABR0BAN2_9CRUS|nr:hypothetical protein OUZ56_033367 [Daphnia magna]
MRYLRLLDVALLHSSISLYSLRPCVDQDRNNHKVAVDMVELLLVLDTFLKIRDYLLLNLGSALLRCIPILIRSKGLRDCFFFLKLCEKLTVLPSSEQEKTSIDGIKEDHSAGSGFLPS